MSYTMAEIDQLTNRIAKLEAVNRGEMESRARLLDRIDELEAAQPEPGPWLRGAGLQAIMPTLKAGDVVEVESEGHTATGKLWAHDRDYLSMGGFTVRRSDGRPGSYIDVLRIIERAPEPEPEPGADIPDEAVAAAGEKILTTDDVWVSGKTLRAALAAADAKRAELEEQADLRRTIKENS